MDTGYETEGLLTFEDQADIGDGWQYIAPVGNETASSAAGGASVSVVHDGPLETCLRVALRLEVPEEIAPDRTRRSDKRTGLAVATYITLRKNDPVVRCRTVVDNGVRDHRLKLLFPTRVDSDRYYTGTPFDIVERSVRLPDYSRHMEKDSGIVPSNGLLAIRGEGHGFAVYSKGLYEAQLRDDRTRTAALTLYRSTRDEVLSDGGDGGQLLGRLEFEYAFRPFAPADASWGDLLAEQQQFSLGIRSVNRKPGPVAFETLHRRATDLPARHAYLGLTGADLIVSACKRAEDDAGAWIVRLWNCSDRETSGSLRPADPVIRAERTNLDEHTVGTVEVEQDNSLRVAAKPKEIVTLKLWFGPQKER
ncbi:glycosyl hydrolase-related protein [Cohnella rhizosphaerae]|uniref:Glycosyl hydrolase-related protein n=1 Tax=Cohnella rhizosphaerae TaxID=1457232 RepID=A0A9X4QUH0_9BACL|nr:glycosyl hydrolase-related protein [Cohnella rhizosphaerae]MDG0810477.1 glycosyl hydrolase-related protein [Cohnella rhizosphaerae]